MARKSATQNGHDRLEEAIAILIQNQAAFVSQMAEAERYRAETERANSERFARIEKDMTSILRVLAEHSRVLEEHSRLLQRLPEAIRDKIGFKPKQEAGGPASQS